MFNDAMTKILILILQTVTGILVLSRTNCCSVRKLMLETRPAARLTRHYGQREGERSVAEANEIAHILEVAGPSIFGLSLIVLPATV